jgi:hypothetical protein
MILLELADEGWRILPAWGAVFHRRTPRSIVPERVVNQETPVRSGEIRWARS